MEKLTRYEQETITTSNAEEDTASVYTCDPAWIRKMDALVKKDKRVILEESDNDFGCKTYIIPKKASKIRLPRLLSALEREKRAIQLKKNFKK